MKIPLKTSLVVVLLTIGCKPSEKEKLPFFNSIELTPEWISKSESKYNKIHKIAAFSYTDQDSLEVTSKTFDGHIYVADYFFTTCPGICKEMSINMICLLYTSPSPRDRG